MPLMGPKLFCVVEENAFESIFNKYEDNGTQRPFPNQVGFKAIEAFLEKLQQEEIRVRHQTIYE